MKIDLSLRFDWDLVLNQVENSSWWFCFCYVIIVLLGEFEFWIGRLMTFQSGSDDPHIHNPQNEIEWMNGLQVNCIRSIPNLIQVTK